MRLLLSQVGALAVGMMGAACENTVDFELRVVLPLERAALSRTDNVTTVLAEQELTLSQSVDDLEFTITAQFEPIASTTTAATYLANGETLLGWGRTVPFPVEPALDDMGVFIGLGGRLATYPEPLDGADANLLAAAAPGRGMLLVRADGSTYLLNHFTYELSEGARFPASVDPRDGGLFAAADGTVLRLTTNQGLSAWRFDPGADTWTASSIPAAASVGPRPGAVLLSDGPSRLLCFGGGGQRDAFAIDLQQHADDVVSVARLEGQPSAAARDGGTAVWVDHGPDHARQVLLFGAIEPAASVVELWGHLPASDAMVGTWVDAGCGSFSTSATDPTAPVRVLCAGGLRQDVPTADAMLVEHHVDGSWSATVMENFLPVAVAEPHVMQDDGSLYYQGDGVLIGVDKVNLVARVDDSAALRANGGSAVLLATGATFLAGGRGADGSALAHWQVFVPQVAANSR